MHSKSSDLSNTFAELKVSTRLKFLLNKEVSSQHFLQTKDLFSKNIDHVTEFSHNGLYYNNPLIYAINKSNVSLVENLLKNGSAPRGYFKYPGLPLYKVIDNMNHNISNKTNGICCNIPELISIMKLLVNYGARFDDYTVHIFWAKFDQVFNSIEEDEKKVVESLYNSSPFNHKKYEIYLEIYFDGFMDNCKDKMMEKFLNKYPIKRSKNFILVNLFSFKL